MKSLLFILVLLVGMGLFYKFDSGNPPEKQPSSDQTTAANVQPATPAAALAWTTYTDTKLGLQFDYPGLPGFAFKPMKLESDTQLLFLHILRINKTNSYINIEVYKGDLTVLPPGPTPVEPSDLISGYQRTKINGIDFETYYVNGTCKPRTYQTVKSNRTYIIQEVCGPIPETQRLLESLKLK